MLLTLLLLLNPAASEAANMCASLKKIISEQEECEDNVAFSKAAEACLRGFKQRVNSEQPRLQKLLLKNTKDAASDKSGATAKQDESEGLSAGAYDTTVKSLNELIAKGTQARGEVEAFRRNLMWPFNWSAAFGGPRPDADDPEVQKMLDEDYCYGEHSDIIKDALAEFDKMLADLTATKVAATGLQGLSTSHQGNLNGGQAAPSATGGQRTGPAPVPAYDGSPKQGKSDISGTKEYEEQQKKGK
jgi:hypothetical protein